MEGWLSGGDMTNSMRGSYCEPLVTMEVRWFTSEEIPRSLFGPGSREPRREIIEDRYLVLPDATAVGVKLRNNKIDLKYLIRDYGVRRFSPKAIGRMAMWGKVSIPVSAHLEIENYVRLEKERWLYALGIDPGGKIYSASFDALPPQNLNFEICKIKLDDQTWWSVCLAAYGVKDSLVKCLVSGFNYIAADVSILGLAVDQSLDFPRWLALRHAIS